MDKDLKMYHLKKNAGPIPTFKTNTKTNKPQKILVYLNNAYKLIYINIVVNAIATKLFKSNWKYTTLILNVLLKQLVLFWILL